MGIPECFTLSTINTSTMRVLFRPSAALSSRLIRCYSTQPTPLVKVFDVPAPGSGRIRILSLARPAARNAISRQLLHELRANIDFIASEYDSEGNELPAKKILGGAAGTDHKGPTRAVVLASDVDSSLPLQPPQHIHSPLNPPNPDHQRCQLPRSRRRPRTCPLYHPSRLLLHSTSRAA